MAPRLVSVLSFMSLFSVAYAESAQNETDPLTELCSMRTELRHIENKGVGYNTGYSSLDIFLAPSPDQWSVMPFLNLRGHVLNDAKFATNVGLGFRALAGCRVYGMNAYWDYRNTHRFHYNQVGVGFETLGTRWDFRLNGYLPVAAKTSHPYHKHSASSVSFLRFSGNNALIQESASSSNKVQFAMKGLDAEVAYHILKNKNFDVYPAIGPYYYQHKNKHAIGGRVRVGAQLTKYLTVEVIDTYDNLFHNNVQGSVSVNIPFGPKPQAKENGRFSGCDDAYFVCQRMLQDVHRQEMIVVDSRHKRKSNDEVSVAINPATGLPYVFYFVDNTSSSAGTFESPFKALLDAQMAAHPGDIIYVFPGDGTSTNMDLGITLFTNQSLLGASLAYPLSTTMGNVIIPPMATTLPVITNTGGAVVTLSGDNTLVSGFYIENLNGSGIQGSLINNVAVKSNTIIGSNNDGVNLQNVGGLVNIDHNAITFFTSGTNYATRLQQSSASCNLLFSNNTVSGNGSGSFGLSTELSNTSSMGSLQVLDNTFLGGTNNEPAINLFMRGASAIELLDVQNNRSVLYRDGLLVDLGDTATLVHANTISNDFGHYPSNGLTGMTFLLANDCAIGKIDIADSILSNTSEGAFIFIDNPSTAVIGEITVSNTQLHSGDNGLDMEFNGDGSVGNILVSNCTMHGHALQSMRLDISGTGSLGFFTMDDCTVSGNTNGQAIALTLNNTGSIGNVSLSNNQLINIPNAGGVFFANLSNTGSIGNLTVDGCTLSGNSNTTVMQFDFSGAGTIGNVLVSNSTFNDNFSSGFVIGTVFQNGSSGVISNMVIDHCDITNNVGSYAVFADFSSGVSTAKIENLVVSNCHLDFGFNGGGVQIVGKGAGTVQNLAITDTTITNSQNDIFINLNAASMNSIVVSNVDASNSIGFAFDANLTNTSTIGSIAIDHFTAEGSLNGIKIDTSALATNIINNFSMSHLVMNSTPNSCVEFSGKGVYGNVSITDSVLNNASVAGLNLGSPITSLAITDCSFEFDNTGIGILVDTTTNHILIANNVFKDSVNQGLQITSISGTDVYSIHNNTFSGVMVPADGYGAGITVNGGNLCLDFQQNQAVPPQVGAFAPFRFAQTGGTFELTAQTTQANNEGTITTSGTVDAPGSCAQ